MKGTNAKKGQFGYIKAQKKREAIKTISMFALSFAIFLFGYFTAKPHSNANLFTVIAMLGLLPASKSTVSLIIFLKAKNTSKEIYEKTLPHIGNLDALYELVLTSYDKNFPISSLVVCEDTVCGYSEDPKCDVDAAGKHIEQILKKNKYKVSVKIFSDFPKYLSRLDSLGTREANIANSSETSPDENTNNAERLKIEQISGVILAISI